ncbi:hypothetical protein BCR39DRAFT_581491 [Naematelia encephala]|uniref:DUF155 domain-containing protein n=1 Tax=Naematelia encephala TaxID=71784 RepID=A0A1Y2ARC6_9TREE|nr:hypothetical protein BCR39DRAFT_581491 [Naematelia encephala]
MSRPTTGTSRPLGTSGKASAATAQPGGATAANIPRRSAGVLPGIARTASSLRQSAPINPSPSTLASLPAHLRNLSTPRIPSPLGKGTPARGVKQSLPVRTSKTTERHVLLPEDPQLAPLPRSPSGSQVNLAPPPRATPGPSSSRHHHRDDERNDAEKMTKREREENRLPRLTAYATAEGYRLKLMQAFLKREHGVGVVRYGASTKVRSSPAVKSPGGVSLLERMTAAEDLGYDDSYFPISNDENGQPRQDPSEYILPHSPPSPLNIVSSMDIPAGHEEEREQMIEEAQERLEVGDGLDDAQDLRRDEDISVKSVMTGTHMSPDHPGYLEHVPSTALSPSDLESPDMESQPEDLAISHSDPPSYHSPHPRYESHPVPQPRPRRKSMIHSNRVAEAVFFSYGVSVFFGFQEEEERDVMEDCETAGTWLRSVEQDDWEVEEFHYVYDPDAEYPRIYNDMFTFKSSSHLFKLSLAHAIAQSTKLSIYEAIMQESLNMTSSFPKELSTTGHLELGRREALKMTGRLFKLRMDVNLIGGILDTPELFWSEASLYPLYEAIREYLEIGPRVQVLNDRLSVAGDLLEIIHEYIEERATHRITWIIIWLIVVACLVEVGEVVARIVFHAIPRENGQFMLVRLFKGVVGP